MILLEFLETKLSLEKIAGSKIDELKQRKLIDPVCNFQLIENAASGEYILDFIIVMQFQLPEIKIE
jgi:hypothetical protein